MSEQLQSIAETLVAPGKGLLAADESTGTITKRFQGVGIESTETTRRDYRETLFRSSALADYISGVILYDETIRQEGTDGRPLVELIRSHGTIPGIKVDKGAQPLAGAPGEKVTEGLDGLRERFEAYYELGARFSKWRAVIAIGDGLPSRHCIAANAHALARYAALSQEAGIVPVVEPEVLVDGDHDIDRCFEVTQANLNALYDRLYEHRVELEGTLLKPNMVLSGKDCPNRAGIEEVAEKTVTCLKRSVPAAVPGIVFLSGGQTDYQATAHLNAMNSGYDLPWRLHFSYARALQGEPMKIWAGDNANAPAAQAAFAHRARMNGLATLGQWRPDLEDEAAA